MRRKIYEVILPAPIEEVWAFHQSADALRVLTPSHRKVELLSADLSVRDGNIHEIAAHVFGVRTLWRAVLSEVNPPFGFVDTALKSPFKSWRHQHIFEPLETGSRLIDVIDYEMPFGVLGRLVDKLYVSKDLDRLFAFRHAQTMRYLSVRDPEKSPHLGG